MKSLLLVFSLLVLTVRTLEYQPDKHPVVFQQDDGTNQLQLGKTVKLGTQIIKGNNGKMYEVTIYPSRKLYETHVESTEHFQTSELQSQSPAINSTPNFGLNENSQQSFNSQQQQFNTLQPNFYQNSAALQNHQNQYAANLNYQQQQTELAHASQQLQQFGMFPQIAQQQKIHQQQQHNNNLQKNLVNNKKYYVSQSEASQLDGSYKQLNNNPRPFLRIITKCDASGQCETQKLLNSDVGDSDFKHQQVLQQSRAQVHLSNDASQQKFNYQFTGNALTSNAAKALRGIPISKGIDLKNRRLFHYCEFAIPQYPHN